MPPPPPPLLLGLTSFSLVPEPSALALLIVGGASLFLLRRGR
ncbi:MAG: PEP-CTERM sorting domain-containing protein [Chloroflexi bacterium]|nr:PEP-CTERM sorting domain-containing protein [Chloroflexota bacterium]